MVTGWSTAVILPLVACTGSGDPQSPVSSCGYLGLFPTPLRDTDEVVSLPQGTHNRLVGRVRGELTLTKHLDALLVDRSGTKTASPRPLTDPGGLAAV